ncbi:hypothetical protein CapIbe_007507 [Capra ibex]
MHESSHQIPGGRDDALSPRSAKMNINFHLPGHVPLWRKVLLSAIRRSNEDCCPVLPIICSTLWVSLQNLASDMLEMKNGSRCQKRI